jgi:hypothetical protein
MLESDGLDLDEAACENKLIVALGYENKAEKSGGNIEIMGSVNKAMKAVQGPAALTLREKMKKLYGHVKITGDNLKLLEWKSASNGEAHFASSEKALKNLEMTLLEILGQDKNHLDLLYPLLTRDRESISDYLDEEHQIGFHSMLS